VLGVFLLNEVEGVSNGACRGWIKENDSKFFFPLQVKTEELIEDVTISSTHVTEVMLADYASNRSAN
jgi:hypothetical protein